MKSKFKWFELTNKWYQVIKMMKLFLNFEWFKPIEFINYPDEQLVNYYDDSDDDDDDDDG